MSAAYARRGDDAAEARRAAAAIGPVGVCHALGLPVTEPRDRSCYTALRAEKTPSTFVRFGASGDVVWFDHGAEEGGDVISLVARALGLDIRRDYGRAIAETLRIASAAPTGPVQVKMWPQKPREYPPLDEVRALWESCLPVTRDGAAIGWLRGRGLDPALVEAGELARVIPAKGEGLPKWANYRLSPDDKTRSPWRTTGHRLLTRAFDSSGTYRSVWARHIDPGLQLPKRLPPSGHKAAGLVWADRLAQEMLAGSGKPKCLVFSEGEPDHMSWSVWLAQNKRSDDTAVIGVASGSWNEELAARVPDGTTVVIRTHLDESGDRYAARINRWLGNRCDVRRLKGSNQ